MSRPSDRQAARRVAARARARAECPPIAILPIGGRESSPAQEVWLVSAPKGVSIDATLEPHASVTEIQMHAKSIRSSTPCRVFPRDENGRAYSPGVFRYRWGDDSEAELSPALDLSRAAAIGLHAGGRTFVAPVDQVTAPTGGAEIDPT